MVQSHKRFPCQSLTVYQSVGSCTLHTSYFIFLCTSYRHIEWSSAWNKVYVSIFIRHRTNKADALESEWFIFLFRWIWLLLLTSGVVGTMYASVGVIRCYVSKPLQTTINEISNMSELPVRHQVLAVNLCFMKRGVCYSMGSWLQYEESTVAWENLGIAHEFSSRTIDYITGFPPIFPNMKRIPSLLYK